MSYISPTFNLALFSPFTLLPQIEETEGILIGEDTYRRKIYLNYKRLPNFHGIIIGPTGSGKSTTVESLLYDLVQHHINVICIDPHQDYVSAINDLNGVTIDLTSKIPDPFEIPGKLSDATISMWADYLSMAAKYSVNLSEMQTSILKLIIEENIRENKDIYNLINELEARRVESPILEDLYIRCRDLFRYFCKHNFSIIDVVNSKKPASIIFTSNGKKLPFFIEKFAALLLINQINEYKMLFTNFSERHSVELIVVVDEAWRLLKMPGYDVDFLYRLREMRKFGVGYWIIIQSATDLPTEAYEQVGFILALSGPQLHVSKVDAISKLSRYDIEWLRFNRRPGYGVLIRMGYPKASQIVIKIRDEVLRRRVRGS